MSVCIYLFRDRVICWTPQTLYSKPVSIARTKWYIVNNPPPIPLNEMVAQQNVSYTMQKGFFILEDALPNDWDERINLIKKIEILSALNTVANCQKSRYTDNTIGQPLADALLIDEIREYRRTSSLENSAILASLLETSESQLSPEGLVTKLWLQYESYRTVIAYLNRLEFTIRELLKKDDFDKAIELLNNEVEKMKV